MILERLTLKGKTAIVSGAGGGGIGTTTCLALAEAGANIVAVDIFQDRLQDTEQRVKALGRECLGVIADLTKRSDIQNAVAQGVKKFGAIHCVANVAGGMRPDERGELENFPEDKFDHVVAMNLKYIYMMNQAVAKHMIEKAIPGTMASVASVSGVGGAAYHAPYGAAKAGLIAITKSMAVEWGVYGIRVNALAPGAVKTPRAVAGNTVDMDTRAKTTIPIGRACEPDEIAAGLLFLLSPLASAISGHTLVVDGGATSKFAFGGPNDKHASRSNIREAPRP
ncbi:MAG: SDR family oxidoreductase [Chloroflexi bacterium]|nr:SDR family oxidoreductase [Chloroflexota bacterium]